MEAEHARAETFDAYELARCAVRPPHFAHKFADAFLGVLRGSVRRPHTLPVYPGLR